MTADRTEKRPWLAAALGVLSPGLGHLYLRLWGRAVLWFGASVVAAWLILPVGVPPADDLWGVLRAFESLPTLPKLALLSVSYLAALDAYWQALRAERTAAGEVCPTCGRRREAGVAFCEWCAERDAD